MTQRPWITRTLSLGHRRGCCSAPRSAGRFGRHFACNGRPLAGECPPYMVCARCRQILSDAEIAGTDRWEGEA